MYVAVKGGERAIANAHALLAKQGRGDPGLPPIDLSAVAGQLGVLVSRVMAEGSLYDPELAARAILQAQGDVLEAVTLVRSYRTTLPRFGYTLPVDTAALPPQRRVSATFKDLPGGQQLGATFDYTHRLFTDRPTSGPRTAAAAGPAPAMPRGPALRGARARGAPAPSTRTRAPAPAPPRRRPAAGAGGRGG
ncbi:carbon-phosphorus lyase complex subunit PhnI, partial [Frankia sp. AgB1.8]|uniref:carbon-phosphorus lyase complex subunit PhnI n=1 Tax=Frankia sp. AgB1.8 TaxID=2792839 RepID=UPI001EE48EE2